ncbi:MAG: Ig-like domain-containing protein, partial [Bacteroidales bacterium]|nr:Ig-like domain-containing protein [Bacteroidales bacterium]
LSLLASCAQESVLSREYDPDQIAYKAFANNATKSGAVDNEHLGNIGDLYISAIKLNDAGYYFSNNVISSSDVSSSTANSGNTPYYWPAYKLGFYAANRSMTVTESNAAKLTPSIDDFTVSRRALNDPDELMVALEAQQRDGNGTPVQLGLHHALSRLTIQVQKTIPGYDISVAGVQIGGFKSVGTFTFPQYNTTNAASDAAWEGLVSANYGNANNLHTCWGSLSTPLQYGSLDISNEALSGTAMTSTAQNVMGGAYFYVIPQGVTLTTAASGSSPDITDHWIDLLVNVKASASGAQIYPSSSNEDEYAVARVYIPASQTFEAGKSYTITLNLSTGLGVSMSNLSLYNGSSSDLSSSLDSENFVKNVSSEFPDNTFILGTAMDYTASASEWAPASLSVLANRINLVDIISSSATLWVGNTTTLVANVEYSTGDCTHDVIWTSSDDDVATVDPSTGVVTAVGYGTATITATSVDDESKSDNLDIYVNEITSIAMSSTVADLKLANTKDISATATLNAGGETYGTPESVNITWSSSNALIASISSTTSASGSTITITGVDKGSATITASIAANAYGSNTNLSGTCSVSVTMVPDGAIPGLFTVDADGTQVYFSKGNLRCYIDASGIPSTDPSNPTNTTGWTFADNQYDFVGNVAANNSIGSAAGWIDYFGWSSTSGTKEWGINTSTAPNTEYSGDFKDWGQNSIYNGTTNDSPNTWRTPSADEYTYLLNTRSSVTVNGVTDARFTKCKVNGILGVLIFPDLWESDSEPSASLLTATVNAAHINRANISWNGAAGVKDISIADFALLEAAGCVFLPIDGLRSGTTVYTNQTTGYYWTSTVASTNACAAYFQFGGFDLSHSNYRRDGFFVRLIQDK